MERLMNDKDPRAFEVLYAKYYSRLRLYIRRRIGSTADSEDLTQSVFVRLWESRARYQKGASVEAYLSTVANNTVAQFVRKKKRRHQHLRLNLTVSDTTDDQTEPKAESADEALPRLWRRVLRNKGTQIPEKGREAIRLRFIERLSTAQAARTAGCSVAAYYSRLERAMKALKEQTSREDSEQASRRSFHKHSAEL
jgi:RNA polymerase sigma-70 factor (ECF subfamily)